MLACTDGEVALTDLRFFVSDLVVRDAAGREHAVVFEEDDRWQHSDVALIDLENGEGSCSNGTPGTNATIDGSTKAADIVAIRFTVGVPFAVNHANPLLAEAPLDNAAMHWHWRSGYKFLRAGVEAHPDGFWIHLGSTGCKGTVGNITSCVEPNRVTVQIEDFSPATDQVAVSLDALFSGVDLTDGVRSDCSSSPAESACHAPFEVLFNDPEQVFRVFR